MKVLRKVSRSDDPSMIPGISMCQHPPTRPFIAAFLNRCSCRGVPWLWTAVPCGRVSALRQSLEHLCIEMVSSSHTCGCVATLTLVYILNIEIVSQGRLALRSIIPCHEGAHARIWDRVTVKRNCAAKDPTEHSHKWKHGTDCQNCLPNPWEPRASLASREPK